MPIHRTCSRCSRAFSVSPSAVEAGKGLYCSPRCYHGTGEERFWANVLCGVTPDACWGWLGHYLSTAPSQQYGRITWQGRMTLAHHISWMIHVGPIPGGKIIRHRCPGGGNSWCTNPRHLAIGTPKDNSRDMVADGRHWSQTGAYAPKRRARPSGLTGDMRELVVILPRTLHRRLAAKAKAEGLSLQALALAALSSL